MRDLPLGSAPRPVGTTGAVPPPAIARPLTGPLPSPPAGPASGGAGDNTSGVRTGSTTVAPTVPVRASFPTIPDLSTIAPPVGTVYGVTDNSFLFNIDALQVTSVNSSPSRLQISAHADGKALGIGFERDYTISANMLTGTSATVSIKWPNEKGVTVGLSFSGQVSVDAAGTVTFVNSTATDDLKLSEPISLSIGCDGTPLVVTVKGPGGPIEVSGAAQ